jgi:hypothetical protein
MINLNMYTRNVFVRINNNNNDLYFNKLTLSAETAVIKRGPAHIKNLQ